MLRTGELAIEYQRTLERFVLDGRVRPSEVPQELRIVSGVVIYLYAMRYAECMMDSERYIEALDLLLEDDDHFQEVYEKYQRGGISPFHLRTFRDCLVAGGWTFKEDERYQAYVRQHENTGKDERFPRFP